MANEQEITFDEPDEGRDIYHEPDDRALIRTKDVYQTELDNGVEGYSETMLAIVANFKNAGKPEGFNVQSMVGKSKRGEVALRLFAVVDDSVADPVFVDLRGYHKPEGYTINHGVCLQNAFPICGKCGIISLTPKDVELAVDGVPKGKGHTTLFAIEAVRGLVGDWMYRCGMPLAEMDEKLPCDEMSVACLMCEHCSLRDTRVEMRVNEAIAKQKAGEAK